MAVFPESERDPPLCLLLKVLEMFLPHHDEALKEGAPAKLLCEPEEPKNPLPSLYTLPVPFPPLAV